MKYLLSLLFAAMFASPTWAANHYVLLTASGANNGTDWTNAFTSIPTGAGLVRGDTYYLATGNYGIYTFNTSESSTSVITFKAAKLADHGTATGWNNTFATDSSPAVFVGSPNVVFEIDRGYLTLDGNGRTSLSGGHGIKIDNSSCTGLCWGLNASAGLTGLTFRYVEMNGKGNVCTSGCEETFRIVGALPSPTGGQSITLQFMYMHDSNSNFMQTQALDTVLVEKSYFDNNGTSSSGNHCTGWADSGSTHVTYRYNVMRDVEGTTMIEPGVNGGTIDTWGVYGNVFLYQSGNPRGKTGTQDGVFAVTNSNANNLSIYNNDFINIVGNASTGIYLYAAGTFTNTVIENNLWYNCNNAAHTLPASGFTFDYNTYLNSPPTNDAGSHSFSNGSPTNPFNNWPNGDYSLVSETADAHLNDGLSLSSPYNIDPTGATRGADGTWERGAYEFLINSTPAPTPAIFTAVPLPSGIIPAISGLIPTQSYVTSKGCSQDGLSWNANCPVRLLCSGCSSATVVTFDGTPITAIPKTGELDLNIPLALLPIPTVVTQHKISLSNPIGTIH